MGNSNEYEVRKKLSNAFDESVAEVAETAMNDPFMGGLMVKAAIASLYSELKDNEQLESISAMLGLNYREILDDECEKALRKYLE